VNLGLVNVGLSGPVGSEKAYAVIPPADVHIRRCGAHSLARLDGP